MSLEVRPFSSEKRGMSLLELCLFTLVGGLVLGFVVFFFWRTRRIHEQQTLELTYQNSFTRLCDRMEKDLTGCRSWEIKAVAGASDSLVVDRIEGPIVYDIRFEAGEIVRAQGGEVSSFEFRGEREGLLKYLEFIGSRGARTLGLRIGLKTSPAIDFSHDFTVRISADKVPGFFDNPQLEER